MQCIIRFRNFCKSSLCKSNDGNLICSFRNLDAVIKLDRKTGEILWTLGGLGDEFNLTDNQNFSRQRNARITEDGYITLYDNGVKNQATRVVKIKLDEENKKLPNIIHIV